VVASVVTPFDSSRLSAVITVLLGVLAIILPYQFSSAAVMVLAALLLASGVVALLHLQAVRRAGFPVGVSAPWAQIVAGVVLLAWPGLALWLVAVLLGGGLILSGVLGLTALSAAEVVNPEPMEKLTLWLLIAFGILLILLGATGSALFLGVVLGIALISSGVNQWRAASRIS